MGSIKDEFLSLIDGKTYAGSSAGVMFLSHYSKSHERTWQSYLGLLPINSFVHYSEEKYRAVIEEFKKEYFENNNEYILLPETEFVIKYY